MRSNVTYWLDESAHRYPNKFAFVDEKKSITFAELQVNANAIACRLQKKGLFKRPIAIYMEKSVDMLVAFMGVAYSGNFYSPIDVHMPEKRVMKILEILKPNLIITTGGLTENLANYSYRGDILLIEELDESIGQDEKICKIRDKSIDTDLLYVLFTSGSTGVPKGVTITHRSVIDYIDWVTETFHITQRDVFGNQAPFYFDNSILDIYSTIKSGATMYIIPQNLFAQPVLLLEFLKAKKINTIFWVPSALIIISKLKAFRNVDISDILERVIFCGEVMPNKQLNIWRNFLPKVQYANLYGPTEITDACTYYIVDRDFADDEPLPIGVPMANTDIFVLNEQNELVTGDEIGELCVRGTALSMGYYGNLEKTKEVFVQNPLNSFVPEIIYRTGDLVKYNSYGELVFLSRKDFQIKHMGHRIELGEIETAVSSLEEISLCCCLYDERRQRIILFIEENLDRPYINSKLSRLVPEYMLPGKVIVLDKMPFNDNGKIDRSVLRGMIENGERISKESWAD